MKYFEKENIRNGTGATADVVWISLEEPTEKLRKALSLSPESIFKDFDKVYIMPYRITEKDIKNIKIKERGSSKERPSLDLRTGNIHLETTGRFSPQLLFVHQVNKGQYGVKVDKFAKEKNGKIKYHQLDTECFAPKACYYPPADDDTFETNEEKRIQKVLEEIFENLEYSTIAKSVTETEHDTSR